MSDYLDAASQKAVEALATALKSSLESAAENAVSISLSGAGAKMEESAGAVKDCIATFNENVGLILVTAVRDELTTHFKGAEAAQNAVSISLSGASAKMEESAGAVKDCIATFNENVGLILVTAVRDELTTHFKGAEAAQINRTRETGAMITDLKAEFAGMTESIIRFQSNAALKANFALLLAACAAVFSFIAAFHK